MGEVLFQLVWSSGGEQEILRDYYTIEEVLKDIQWKDPLCYFIGELSTKKGYTIPEFIGKYL